MKKLLLLLFVCSNLFSQTINFKGNLLDKETNKPVVYANISFLKSNTGISSLEDGTFNLEIDRKLLKEQLHISCLNYKDTVVIASNLQNKTLFLQPKFFELDEVFISRKGRQELILDKVRKKVYPFHTFGLRMVGKYFPNKLKEDYFIDKISIFFAKRGYQKAKFRIRVFSVDELTGKPREDILTKSIPISIEGKQKKVELNLEEYYIELPKNGVFIVFEKLLIPYNLYELSYKNEEKQEYYAPVIGLTKSKEFKGINRIYYYNRGDWYTVLMPDNDFSSVPAISLTLSN
jgi:hypothetical protein